MPPEFVFHLLTNLNINKHEENLPNVSGTDGLDAFGAANAGAQERIPFDAEHFTFHNYTGWDADAVENGVFEGAFILGQADGCPIGDTSCNAWVDLTGYSKLYVEMIGCDADGVENGSNPRIFINRTVENGQFSSDKNSSNCLVIPNSGTWATDYYTQEGNTYIIDLKKIATDWGFALPLYQRFCMEHKGYR